MRISLAFVACVCIMCDCFDWSIALYSFKLKNVMVISVLTDYISILICKWQRDVMWPCLVMLISMKFVLMPFWWKMLAAWINYGDKHLLLFQPVYHDRRSWLLPITVTGCVDCMFTSYLSRGTPLVSADKNYLLSLHTIYWCQFGFPACSHAASGQSAGGGL